MTGERFEWYYMGETGQIGPLSESQILDLAEHSALTRKTLVWKVGMSSWVPAESIPKLASKMQPTWTPPPVPTPPPVDQQPVSRGAVGVVQCPRDRTPLRHENRSGVEIDWCPTCKGVWLDKGELEKLTDRESKYYDDDDDHRRRGRRGGFLDNVFDIFD